VESQFGSGQPPLINANSVPIADVHDRRDRSFAAASKLLKASKDGWIVC
jgi:hypothetical protein